MELIDVTRNTHSIVFSRGSSFITSVPIRRRIQRIHANGAVTWVGVDPKPGEVVDLMKRLTIAVNSDRPGSLLQKIYDEMATPYTPTVTVTKNHQTRVTNFKNRVKAGRGHVMKIKKKSKRKARNIAGIKRQAKSSVAADISLRRAA